MGCLKIMARTVYFNSINNQSAKVYAGGEDPVLLSERLQPPIENSIESVKWERHLSKVIFPFILNQIQSLIKYRSLFFLVKTVQHFISKSQ